MNTRDTNHNGIPDIGNTTYDTWGLRGDNLLCGGLWVGALEAMEQMAMAKGDAAFSKQLHDEYTSIKPTLDSLFWKSNLKYYKLDVSSDALMADGLNGERYCETTGLDPILPPDRMASHLNKVYEMCVKPFQDFNGDGEGDVGMVNGVSSSGGSLGFGQPSEVWTGSSYFTAALMYHWGQQLNDTGLVSRALKTAHGVYYQTWINEQTAYFFDTPEAWNCVTLTSYRAQQYQRPRAIWELLLEIKNPFSALTSVSQKNAELSPSHFTLFQNYPNPFNPSTTLRFGIPMRSHVRLLIYNVLGQVVQEMMNEELAPGFYEKIWKTHCASGLYFYQLDATSTSDPGQRYVSTKKMILLR